VAQRGAGGRLSGPQQGQQYGRGGAIQDRGELAARWTLDGPVGGVLHGKDEPSGRQGQRQAAPKKEMICNEEIDWKLY